MKKELAYLQLTKACNLKCSMCKFYENNFENLWLDHFYKIIDILSKNWIKWITFWWWEPFLNKNIYEIVSYAKGLWLKTCIITNWTILLEDKLKDLLNNLDELLISIDSSISSIHDEIRWKEGTYNIVIKFLEFVSLNKPKCLDISIDTTIQKINYNNFYTIIDLAKKYNTKLNFDPVQLYWYGNNADLNLKFIDSEIKLIEWKLIELKNDNWNRILQSYSSLYRIIDYFRWKDITLPCKSLFNDLILDPMWNIIECWWRSRCLYNILEEWKILDIKSFMSYDCKKCWFSHVRDADYDDWYNPLN
jgi:MoaA/NifB/PqqE/SkfB family radical SAM enzyme